MVTNLGLELVAIITARLGWPLTQVPLYMLPDASCFSYQVLVPPDPELMGKLVDVKILSAGKHHLMGGVLSSHAVQMNNKQLLSKERTDNTDTRLKQSDDCSQDSPPWSLSSSVRLLDVCLIVLLFSLVFICVYKLGHWNIIRTLFFV